MVGGRVLEALRPRRVFGGVGVIVEGMLGFFVQSCHDFRAARPPHVCEVDVVEAEVGGCGAGSALAIVARGAFATFVGWASSGHLHHGELRVTPHLDLLEVERVRAHRVGEDLLHLRVTLESA